MRYCIDVDITMSKRLYVDAANENEAKAEAIRRVKEEPHYHVGSADAFVCVDVVDVDIDCDND